MSSGELLSRLRVHGSIITRNWFMQTYCASQQMSCVMICFVMSSLIRLSIILNVTDVRLMGLYLPGSVWLPF